MRAVTYEHYHRLLALACLIAEPDRHAITLPQTGPALRSVRIQGQRSRSEIARRLGVQERVLADLNAGFTGPNLGFSGQSFELLVPGTLEGDLAARIADVGAAPVVAEASEPEGGGKHVVRAGESLWSISRKHGIGLAALQALNPGVGRHLKLGQVLRVPGGEAAESAAAQTAATATPEAPATGSAAVAASSTAPAAGPVTPEPSAAPNGAETTARWHVVRSGDSLWRIARAHSMRVADLAARNAIDPKTALKPGQRLRIDAPPADEVLPEASVAPPD